MHDGIRRVRVLGIPVDAVDMSGALEFVDSLLEAPGLRNCILAVNPEKIRVLSNDDVLRAMFESATLLLPDGIGVVMAARFLHGVRISRVPGADLMQNLCARAARNGRKVFIYGAGEDVNREAAERLRKAFPGIKIVGRCNGYVAEEEMDGLIQQINASGADLLFVALGSPRQELWMQRYLPLLNVKVCQGIGGTLDTIVGTVKRAPAFWQRIGLEWFYRLMKEPKRIRRQAVLPLFVLRVLMQRIGA